MVEGTGARDQGPEPHPDALARAVDRDAIRDLVARYNANGDSGRFAAVRELFIDDAVMTIVGDRDYRGIDEIMSIFTGTKSSTGGRLTHVRHFTSTHQIDLDGRDAASGRLYYAVLTDVGLDHWGRYVDSYVRTSSGWKFASRSVSVDGWSADSLFPHS